MRKKWLVIGGVGLTILVLIGSTLILTKERGDACERLIKATLDDDGNKSYGLLSDRVQQLISKEDWQKKTENWYMFYATSSTTYKLDKTTTNTDPDTKVQTKQEEYVITAATGTYRGTCYLNENGKVDAYTSKSESIQQ